MSSTSELSALTEQLALGLRAQGLRMATAESCSGGWVAQQATSLAGSSDWFECGFVTYSNEAKQRLLGVRADTLERFGAVSEEVVKEMAMGALAHCDADTAVAISGIAGPDGGSAAKPVGTVWLAWARDNRLQARCFLFSGDRCEVRYQSVVAAFKGLLEINEIN